MLAAALSILPVASFSCMNEGKGGDQNIVSGNTPEKICAAYIATWGVYDPVKDKYRNWTASDIDGKSLTDLILSFAELSDKDHVTLLTEEIESYYGEVRKLVKKYPDLRVSLAIGGGSEGINDFRAMAADSKLRSQFVDNVKKLLEENTDIKGIDIDWEYPGKRLKYGSSDWKTEFDNYIKLMNELKTMMTKLGKKNGNSYRLTTALPADVKPLIENVTSIQEVCDSLNLMMYDFHGAWSETTGHNAPLDEVEKSLNNFLEAGALPEKLVLGIPFYGQRWKGVEEKDGNHGLGSKVSPDYNSDYGIQYPKVVQLLEDKNYTRYWDQEAKSPYIYNSVEKVFISYADEEYVKYAMQLVRENKLSGAMTWEYGQDMSKTLLKAMHQGVL